MKRRFSVAALLVIPAVALAGVASARPSVPLAHPATGPAKFGLRNGSLGKILVNGAGFTLYMFTKDGCNKDQCVTIKQCDRVWPPDTTHGKPKAGAGVSSSLLGTITLKGGVKQVTYAGHPLYRYSGDTTPGATDYVGTPQFGGRWYALNAAGHTVKHSPQVY